MRVLVFLFLILLFAGCDNGLPHKHGVYIYHNDSVTAFDSNKTMIIDNLHQGICGIRNPDYTYNRVDSLIIFFKEIDTSLIRLTQLRYFNGEFVEGITGHSKWADVDLWVADQDIAIDKIFLKQKSGMMAIKPKTRLLAGSYALHFGSLWDCKLRSDSVMNYVYSFRIRNQLP